MTTTAAKLPLGILLIFIALSGYTPAQSQPEDKYERKEFMIPMRDGIRLHTVVFTPKDQGEVALPFLLLRTLYGAHSSPSPEKNIYVQDMAAQEYLFVYQAIRGRYSSEGKHVSHRFPGDRKN